MAQIILDACCNHLGNRQVIHEMITLAAQYADYIKFQLYDVNYLNPNYPDFDEVLVRMRDAELGVSDIRSIIEVCEHANIMPMFTVYTPSAISDLQVFYDKEFTVKIASPDMTNINLIDEVIDTFPRKKLFISTGMSSNDEIALTREKYSKHDIAWLYCVSHYPTHFDDIDFNRMGDFDGFSDHTTDLEAIKSAMLIYPKLEYVEKHFTLSRNIPTKDRIWSIEPEELTRLQQICTFNDNVNKYKTRWVR